MASQMKPAIFDRTGISIETKNKEYSFQANGSVLKFDGFLRVYSISFEDKEIPEFKKDEKMNAKEIKSEQHFTKPPARFNEATLVKVLESHGIGRPSTYAPIISTIQDRNYVIKTPSKQLEPTEDGWHTFGLHWSTSGYVFYVDGKLSWEIEGPVSHREQFILISTECKGYRKGGPAPELLDAELPDYFVVDYIRVFDEVE